MSQPASHRDNAKENSTLYANKYPILPIESSQKKHREQFQHNIRSEHTAFAYAWIQKFSHRRRRAIEGERGKERGGTGKIDNARELKRHKRTNIKTVHLSV